jgi:hypothetical protein
VLPPGIERSSRSTISRDLSVLIAYPASVTSTLLSTYSSYISTKDHSPLIRLPRIVFYGIDPTCGRSSYSVLSPPVVDGPTMGLRATGMPLGHEEPFLLSISLIATLGR